VCLPRAEYCCHSKEKEERKGQKKKKDRKLHRFLIMFSHVIGKWLLVSVNLEKG